MASDDHASPPGPPWSRAVPHDVRKAVDHMRVGLERRITTAELVRVSGVSERTLHRHFLDFLGLSPLAHLRRLRLAAARVALLVPGGGASITEVAARFGFTHLGRFSSDYRSRFGEPPSATLARGRAAAVESAAVHNPAEAKPHPAEMRRIGAGPSLPALCPWAPALVLLPFRTDGGRLEERALAEALAEQLAAALSRIHAVSIHIGRLMPGEPERAARALGARYCLTGRIARTPGGCVRVVARLLDLGAGDLHLWGDAYDGTTEDLFGLQDRVVESVAHAVGPCVQGAEIEHARRKPACNLSAHDLVLRALPLVLAADPISARQALDILEEAMGLNPDSPAPVALAGWCRAQLVLYQATPDPVAERTRALRLAERAAALDPLGDPLVLTARGSVTMMARHREEAEALLARAQAIDPGFAWAWERSAWIRANFGEAEAALAHFRRAVPLKGLRFPMANCAAGVATAHFSAGRYEESASWFRRALAENPAAVWLNRVLVPCYLALGNRPAAYASLDRLRQAYPAITVDHIAMTLPWFCEGRARGADGPIMDGLASLGLP